jgi:molybdopterin synthase catalytic subunit
MVIEVMIGESDFDLAEHYEAVRGLSRCGAVVAFVGQVRDDDALATTLTLECYLPMARQVLQSIAQQARVDFDLSAVRIVHRVGVLAQNAQIILVLVAAGHRKNAFEAAQFIMDVLKTEAPFWKKISNAHGEQWIQAKSSDEQASKRWQYVL